MKGGDNMSDNNSRFNGLLWDRSLSSNGGEVSMTNVPLDGSPAHVSQYDRSNNTRFSWNTDGTGAHFINQNVPKGNEGRH